MYAKLNYETPIGTLVLVRDQNKLIGAWFEDQAHFAKNISIEECIISTSSDMLFKPFIIWLDAYFAKQNPQIDPLLPFFSPKGTQFQKAIWQELLTIPYGKTLSYLDIAQQYNQKGFQTSARAVGGAVGKNPLSIFIPCHRVIGKNKTLTGYAGGLPRKTYLLELESHFD